MFSSDNPLWLPHDNRKGLSLREFFNQQQQPQGIVATRA
jgi:hypothetical protein